MAVRLGDLVKTLGGDCALPAGGGPWIRDVHLDSRLVGAGDLFAALPGRAAEGLRFVGHALSRGASAVLSPTAVALPGAEAADLRGLGARAVPPTDSEAVPNWVHPQARRIAGEAAAIVHELPGRALALFGITGTNGKTTTAHLCGAMLTACGRRPAVLGTAGHRVAGEWIPASHTTPDAPELQRLLARHVRSGGDTAVLEVSSHALEQERTSGLQFAVAVFTNLSRDHLDYHGDMESYAAAKEKLFAGLGPGASAIIHADDPAAPRMERAARRSGASVVTYSTRLPADLRASEVESDLQGTRLLVNGMGISQTLMRIPLVGRFNAENALAALAAVLASGASPSKAMEGLASASPPPGRMELVPTGSGGPKVFVDYAHSPEAMRAVLEHLRTTLERDAPTARLICVFGCGGDRDRGKRAPMGRVACELADLAIATSDNPRSEDPEAILGEIRAGMSGGRAQTRSILDRREAIAEALAWARPGDVLLIAGKGHERTQTIGGLTLAFDDRSVIAEVLARC